MSGDLPPMLMVHQGGDLYGSDRVFSEVVRIATQIAIPSVVLGTDGPLRGLIEAMDVPVDTMDLGVLRRGNMNATGILKTAAATRRARHRLARMIRQTQARLVYSNTLGVVAGAMAARAARVGHVWHVHEIIERPRPVASSLARYARARSEVVLCVSDACAENLMRLAPRGAPVQVVHNGIDLRPIDAAPAVDVRREFSLPAGSLVVSLIARIHFWKGQDFLLSAVAALPEPLRSSVRVLLVGDVFPGYGRVRDDLVAQANTLGIADQVVFCGYRPDAAAVMKGSDVVVVPSVLPDPLPTTVLEGMACGKPVVATNVGGIPEMVVDDVTGLLVPPGDVRALAAALERMLGDGALRGAMGVAGRARVERDFSREQFAHAMRRILETRLAGAQTREPT